jgi:hypothetical protein
MLLRVMPASPVTETLDEFLARARHHYRETETWLRARGMTDRPIKRELDHFRYLAVHLIGGHSWAEIAAGEVASLAGESWSTDPTC